MNSSSMCVFVVAIVASFSGVISAQADSRNAATYYQRAADRIAKMNADEWWLVISYDPSTGPPSQAVRDAVRKAQPMLNEFHRASLQPYADFHLDHSQGFALLLPHLRPMRDLVRLANTDAYIRLADGDAAGAANRLAAVGRTLQHYGDDRTMISSLVGQSSFHLADQAMQAALDRASFSPAEALKVLQPLEQLALSSDPFNFLECIAMEHEVSVLTISRVMDGVLDIQALGELVGGLTEEQAQLWEGMTADEFDQHVAAFDDYMADVVDIFAMDDPEVAAAELARIEQEFHESQENPLSTICASFSKVLEAKQKTDAALAKRISSLRELVEGEVQPEDVANAAMWYLRAIEQLREWDEAQLGALRALHVDSEAAMSDELNAALRDAEPIIETIREAAQLRRCDFSVLRPRGYMPFLPHYVPGMRDLFRLLHADAMRLLQSSDYDAAAERLAVAYRVVGHLGSDEHLFSALTAHRAYEGTHDLAENAIIMEHFAEQHREMLVAGFMRIARADPFGYAGAVRNTRRALEENVRRGPLTNVSQDIEADVVFVRAIDGDSLLPMVAFVEAYLKLNEHVQRHGTEAALAMLNVENSAEEASDAFDALLDIISRDELDSLRTRVDSETGKAVTENMTPLAAMQLPVISTIDRRMRQARGDLRLGMVLLQPPAHVD